MAATEEQSSLSELEVSSLSESSESIDFSCIHWGYLNCTLVTEQGKKAKDLIWHTYWVDLCCSTIRLYRDLSLPPDSAESPPPTSVVGPTNENEKKQAFLMLKKGAAVAICDYEEEFKSRKRARKDVYDGVPTRKNVFKLAVAPTITNSPVYLFQAPSKGSMYRWISKIVEGIENADQPQNQSASDKKLKEAKLVAMEQRRYHVAPELRYPEKDDGDSLLEADVDENFTYERPLPNPKLEELKEKLRQTTDLLNQVEKEEENFLGSKENCQLAKVCRFEATTKRDYYLVPGHKATLLQKGTKLTIFGQLPNKRWRCCAEVVREEERNNEEISEGSAVNSDIKHQEQGQPDVNSSTENETKNSAKKSTQILIGSVPSSLLVELDREEPLVLPSEGGTPLDSPVDSQELPIYPSPPSSPYSKHRSSGSIAGSEKSYGERPSPRATRKFIPDEEAPWPDEFPMPSTPSCQSSRTTSRSTTPSNSPEGSLNGSVEQLNDLENEESSGKNLQNVVSSDRMVSRNERAESSISSSSDIPVTFIGSETEDDREITVIDVSSSPLQKPKVNPRIRDLTSKESGSSQLSPLPQNYSFQVTRKLRQRGISLIVGSSSSEDEDEELDKKAGASSSKLSYRKVEKEFQRFEAKEQGVRPFSAVVTSRKRASINLGPRTTNISRRCVLNDSLLSEYSSHSKAVNGKFHRSKTCSTIRNLTLTSTTEKSPPLNQKRLLEMKKPIGGGYGFTLQTYGIVQSGGEVDYTTFVLGIEEDGPAYMAGLRPGDIIVEIEGKPVDDADHKTVVSRIQAASVTVRLTAVFVDAIRKMKLNTQMKLLKAELQDKEKQLEKLNEKENEILEGRKVDLNDIDLVDGEHSSFLFTTEMTSSFARDSPIVHDSIYEYKQQPGDNKHRRVSLPDTSELKRRYMVATTGTELLRNFATLPANFAKCASTKLQKSLKKKKPLSNTFKSYLDLEEPSSSQESLSVEGSPLRTSDEKLKNAHRSMDSLTPKTSVKQKRPRSLPENLRLPIYSLSTTYTSSSSSSKNGLANKQSQSYSTETGPWVRRDELPEVAVRPPTPPELVVSKLQIEGEKEYHIESDRESVSYHAPTRTTVVSSFNEAPKTSTPSRTTTELKTTAAKNQEPGRLPSGGTNHVITQQQSPFSDKPICSTQEQGQSVVKAKVVATEVVVHPRVTVTDSSVCKTKSTERARRNDSPSRIADMLGRFEIQGQQTQAIQKKCETPKAAANATGKNESEVTISSGGTAGKVSGMLEKFESRTPESTRAERNDRAESPSRVTVVMDNIEVRTHKKVPPPVSPKPKRSISEPKITTQSQSQGRQRSTTHQPWHLYQGPGRPESYVMAVGLTADVPSANKRGESKVQGRK